MEQNIKLLQRKFNFKTFNQYYVFNRQAVYVVQ